MSELDNALVSSYFFDYEDVGIQQFVEALNLKDKPKSQQAVMLYHAIRDGWRYYAYQISLDRTIFKASSIINRKQGNCIEKSVVLIACLRSLGIPANISLAKVKNHIAAEAITEQYGTDELTPHGYVSLYLDGKWLKVSPTFNKELSLKYNVEPLGFDGKSDALLQQFNGNGEQFMEYLKEYGTFEEFPYDFVISNMEEHYPGIYEMIEKKFY